MFVPAETRCLLQHALMDSADTVTRNVVTIESFASYCFLGRTEGGGGVVRDGGTAGGGTARHRAQRCVVGTDEPRAGVKTLKLVKCFIRYSISTDSFSDCPIHYFLAVPLDLCPSMAGLVQFWRYDSRSHPSNIPPFQLFTT